MSEYKSAPALPLWAWLVVAVAVALFMLSAIFLEPWVDRHENSVGDNFNLARLENTSNSIVMIGSSLIRDALYPGPAMADRFKKNTMPVIKITKNNAHQQSFEPILPIVASARPRLVFIEADMLLIDRYRFHTLQAKVLHIASWLRRSVTLFGDEPPPAFASNFEPITTCTQKAQPTRKQSDVSGFIQSQFTILKEPVTPAWHSFITNIKAQGGTVILLDIGRSPTASQALTESFVKDYTQALAAVRAQYPLELWRFPGPFEQQNYCDAAHLNTRGRAVFVEWFTAKITEVLGD